MSLLDTFDAFGLVLPGDRVSVAAIREGEIRPGVFTSIEEITTFFSGLTGWNQYFCPNPIREGVSGRPKAIDVTSDRWLLIDVDPAPDEEAAHQTAQAVYGYCSEKGVESVLVDSGRGRQVLLCVYSPDGRKKVVDFFRQKFERTGARIDSTSDPARLCRMPGTINLKTGRTAKILARQDGGNLQPDDLPDTERVATDAPWQAPDFVLHGIPEGKRDDAVFRYACRLRSSGKISKDEALVLVLSAARACKPPFSESAARDKVERAWRYPSGSEALEVAVALAAKCHDDPGAPFEPKALEALRVVRDKDLSAWQRIRADLKNTRAFRISDLERRMDEGREAAEPGTVARMSIQDGELVGQYFRRGSEWVECPMGTLRSWLKGKKIDPDEGITVLMEDSWDMVVEPFQPEELEGRRWNKDAARLAFEPGEGKHETWDMILRNIGKNLDEPARAAGFESGAHYLLVWLASVIQFPFEPTAYLFFHGDQGGGKSTFHEAAKILFTKGCVDAGQALTSKEGFNGEVARAVICYVEEIDLSDARKTASARIKKWTTGKFISIHAKYETPHDLRNPTHWVQCANSRSYGAVLPGDTRITVCRVDVTAHQVPKEELFDRLRAEAGAFTKTLLELVVPKAKGRLRVPALESVEKKQLMDSSRSPLEVWIEEAGSDVVAGYTDRELVQEFQKWAGPREALRWDTMKILRELPETLRKSKTGQANEKIGHVLQGGSGAPDGVAAVGQPD